MKIFWTIVLVGITFGLAGCSGCDDTEVANNRVNNGANNGSNNNGSNNSNNGSNNSNNGGCADLCGEICCGEGEACVDDQCIAACPGNLPHCQSDAGPLCCGSNEGCVFETCVELGPECDANTPCPFTHFCEPTLNRCVDINDDPNACLFAPPIGDFAPVEAFTWSGSATSPTFDQVMMAPVVGNLTDDNADGNIDENDIPDIVFTTFAGGAYTGLGVLRVISGDDGREHWSSSALDVPIHVWGSAGIALGDIDGDGIVEIVLQTENNLDDSGGGVIALEHDGTVKWRQPLAVGNAHGGSAIANIDGQGSPEIVTRSEVLSASGQIICSFPTATILPLVADLDRDGIQEIVHGQAIYKMVDATATDGSGCQEVAPGFVGYTAIAQFDNDPEPEIVVAHDGQLSLLESDGTEKWKIDLPLDTGRIATEFGISDCNTGTAGQACTAHSECGSLPARCMGNRCYVHKGCHRGGGPPTIADFDGDRQPEIGIATRWYYLMVEADGTIAWAHKTKDFSSAVTGSSVFDFEGDGRAEVVYNDELNLRVYSGSSSGVDADNDGFEDPDILLEVQNSSGTLAEYPIIVDVDNDGSAEIIVMANNYGGQALYSQTHGIRVFKDVENRWVGTRPIWNQHSYHVTNVNDDGTIPLVEINNWELSWLNNYRQNVQGGNPFTAPNLVVSILSVEGVACATGGMPIQFEIRNEGSIGVRANALEATIYIGESGGALTAVETIMNSVALPPGGKEIVNYTWTPTNALIGKSIDVRVVVDDNGMGVGRHNECIEDDNSADHPPTVCEVPQ